MFQLFNWLLSLSKFSIKFIFNVCLIWVNLQLFNELLKYWSSKSFDSMSGSIFYKTSSSNCLSSSASAHIKPSLSASTSALFEMVSDSADLKSPELSSAKRFVISSSPNSVFNRLKTGRSGCNTRVTSLVRRQTSSSIFNIIGSERVLRKDISKSEMPSHTVSSEVIQSKSVSADVEAMPWTTRGRNTDPVSLVFNWIESKSRCSQIPLNSWIEYFYNMLKNLLLL